MSPARIRILQALAATGLIIAAVSIAPFGAKAERPPSSDYESYANRSTITLGGTFRDFADDHADFTGLASDGAGRYAGFFADELSDTGKPKYLSSGRKVERNALNSAGHSILSPRSHVAARPGDASAQYSQVEGHAMTASGAGQLFKNVPNVNTWAPSEIALTRDHVSGNFVFEGSLDSGGPIVSGDEPAGNAAYTQEISTTFVYEAGHDLFVEAETGGEMWVYIDGKLVIDGGAGKGGGVDFEIVDGRVIPREHFVAKIQVLGAAIGNGSYEFPVTLQATIGDDVFEPFGGFDTPTTGNLNDDQTVTGSVNPGSNPRSFSPDEVYEPNTEIAIDGASWLRSSGATGLKDDHWSVHRSHGTHDDSPQVFVLRDGDEVPDIAAMYNQASIAQYVDNFVDPATNTVNLAVNDIIYLFELGASHSSSRADFQDLVALVTLAPADPTRGPAGDPDSVDADGVPLLRQRIELNRLTHLQDGRTHDLKIFYLDRTGGSAPVRFETNITTLRLAAIPKHFQTQVD